MLIEPLIRRVKFRQDDDQHFHLADRTVSDPGRDDDAHARFHLNDFVIEFHFGIGLTLQKEIGFGECLVVMLLSVFANGIEILFQLRLIVLSQTSAEVLESSRTRSTSRF